MENSKIFCIGFQKTGTTSLETALEILGYKVCGRIRIAGIESKEKREQIIHETIHRYDAFQDNPWSVLYMWLDENYPNSKFILTLRPTDRWIKSVTNHFGGKSTAMREWIYGVGDPVGNEHRYIKRYEKHNKEVLEYFAERPNDLLVLNLTEGDGWEKLCNFLKQDIPNRSFPHSNKGAYTWYEAIILNIKGALQEPKKAIKYIVRRYLRINLNQ